MKPTLEETVSGLSDAQLKEVLAYVAHINKVMTLPEPQRCDNCLFSAYTISDPITTDTEVIPPRKHFTCHRHAPTNNFSWPGVRNTDWCGEHSSFKNG